MDKGTAQRFILNTFRAPFDRKRYRDFINEVCNGFDESKAQSMRVPEAFAPHVKSCYRLGTFHSASGELADILIVNLTESFKLERSRTALRDFVAHKLKRGEGADNSYKEASLVAFVAPDSPSWRFSYVRMEYDTIRDPRTGKIKPEERLTPARRLSYLVGPDEECHTAQSRFLSLLQDAASTPSLGDIEEAFSVESVTQEFFEEYARLFEVTHKELERVVKNNRTVREDFHGKGVRTVDFAKKLLGQIVFLYFIQKKGWLGVAKGASWGSGSRHFLRQLAARGTAEKRSLFNDLLEPLFYDTLASDRGHEAWCEELQCRIPFLNGGLFEPLAGYQWDKTDIDLPNSLFTNNTRTEAGDVGTGILDVFDRYNFTVNESEPLEVEVAIDPEMLGKVFENLIEDNRRKGLGAFYTPREIVHFMCQESLINYLDTALNKQSAVSKTGTGLVPRPDIESWIRQSDQFAHYASAMAAGTKGEHYPKPPVTITAHAARIDELLKDIAVCDPAIGSGAFPVGMMSEVVRARLALTPYFNDVSERTAYYFKRHAIQSSLYGADIDPGAVEIAKLRLWLSLVVDEVDVQQIKPLPNLDYKVVVADSLVGVHKDLFNNDRFQRLEELKSKFFNESNRSRKLDYKREIEELISGLTKGRSVFDFEMYFSEVFHARGGFDVVIANPPYISVEKFARTEQQREWKRRFKTYASRGDVYCLFYEQALDLLRDGGVLTFISSNKFQRASYGTELRRLLTSQGLQCLIDFCELPVFAASTDPMIVIASKGPADGEASFPVLVVKDEAELTGLTHSLATRASRYTARDLRAEGWSLEGSKGLALLERLRARGTSLVKVLGGHFYYGIKTGLNEAFVIDAATRERLIREDRNSVKLIKPWIRGKDVKRWAHVPSGLYAIAFPFHFHKQLSDYPAILRHLTIFEKRLKARGQCKTSRSGAKGGQHHWLELDNNPSADYLALFEQDRVVLPIIKKTHGFAYVKGGSYSNDKTTFFISDQALFLLAVLNSTIIEWMVRMDFPGLGDPWAGGRIEYRAGKVKALPIPLASRADKAELANLAEQASRAVAAGDHGEAARIERKIDRITYRLFELTSAEIALVETALVNSRAKALVETNDDD